MTSQEIHFLDGVPRDSFEQDESDGNATHNRQTVDLSRRWVLYIYIYTYTHFFFLNLKNMPSYDFYFTFVHVFIDQKVSLVAF